MRITAVITAAIAGLAALALPAAPAAAAEGDTHCVAEVTPGTPEAVCFDSFAEALQFASGGTLTKGPKNNGSTIRGGAGHQGALADLDAMVDAANSITSHGTVISIEYTGSNFTGSDLIWVGYAGNCSTSTNNIDYEISSMPTGWNNVITSFRTYANCWDQHWEGTSHTGAVVGYQSTRSQISAAMDNQTSSQRWS